MNLRSLISRLFLFISFMLGCAMFSAVAAQGSPDALKKWEDFDFRGNNITFAQISALELNELKLLRGIVFGRHGRVFKDLDIRAYLESRPWYKADPNFQNSALNNIERTNLDIIRDAEARKHPNVEPGDMRFYRTRLLTRKKLGQHTGAEWTVLASEIEAIHGKQFDDTPWLQQYFEDRYWYRPASHYDPKGLSDIEKKNIALMNTIHRQQRRVALSPGDMEFFENKLISERMLHGLSLHELRLL